MNEDCFLCLEGIIFFVSSYFDVSVIVLFKEGLDDVYSVSVSLFLPLTGWTEEKKLYSKKVCGNNMADMETEIGK